MWRTKRNTASFAIQTTMLRSFYLLAFATACASASTHTQSAPPTKHESLIASAVTSPAASNALATDTPPPTTTKVASSCADNAKNAASKLGGTAREVLAVYERACQDQCADACNIAGVTYRIGPQELRNDTTAAMFFQRACAGRSASGCCHLALMHRMGRGVPQDYDAAKKAYAKACDAGDGDGCGGLGDMFEHQVSFASDSEKAARHYSRGCELGSAISCAGLADLYRAGRGVSADANRALDLYKRGCVQGSSYGCTGAAKLLEQDPATAAKAEEFARTAVKLNTAECDDGDPYNCSLLGDAYREGRGVQKDLNRAFQLYQSGCKNGMQAGCDGLRALTPGKKK
ncbi:MAG TPA: tetratricopeptide repeat protein [Polyangiaceae bacterium]|nr:tetratricopeptide repeat protein [Polyangiaceae bacterium]